MGVVVAAHHIHLDEKVAIKFLLPDALNNPEAVARFAREARAAVKIKSDHVARIIDVGTLDTGAPYIVMEYLEGGDLSAWITQRGALPIEQAVEFILQASEALADAHGLGIVHRDLKPANLFCIRRNDGLLSVKVLDFGISKLTTLSASGPDMSMTKTSTIMGSPMYMSPEQLLSSRDVDARTDIWALGVILYELLTGKAAFNGETLAELCVKISTQPAPALRDSRPDAPLGLQEVISKCLQKDRNNRYANIAQLANAIFPYGPRRARDSVERISRIIQAAGLSESSLALPPSSEAFGLAPGTQASWGQTKSRTLWGKAGSPLGVVFIGLLVVGAGALIWLARGRMTSGETQSPSAHAANPVSASNAAMSESTSASVAPALPPQASAPIVLAAAPDAGVAASPQTSQAKPTPNSHPATARAAASATSPRARAQSPAAPAGSHSRAGSKPPPANDPFAQPH
jgi:serine/threonine protein kinase